MNINQTYNTLKQYIHLSTSAVLAFLLSVILPVAVSAQEGLVTCGTDTDDNGVLTNPCGWDDFIGMINGLVEWLIIIATSVAVLLFIYAGFLYLTSGGDDSQVSQAKTIFINVAVGFSIMLLAYLIVITIVSLLTGEGWLQENQEFIPVDLS